MDSLISFLESAPDPAIVADDQNRILVVNHSAESLFGYRHLELIGQPMQALVPALPTNQPDRGDPDLTAVVGRHSDGHSMRLSVAFRAVPIDDQSLTAAYFRVGEADPTLDRLPVPIARFDLAGSLTYANLAFAATIGVPRPGLTNRTPAEFGLHDGTGAAWSEAILAVATTGVGRRFDFPIGTEANERWFAATASAERGQDGAVGSVLIALQNISDRNRAEAALEAAELRFRRVTEGSQDLISQHAADGTFLYASPAANSILACTPAELLGKKLFDFAFEDDRNHLMQAFKEAAVRESSHLINFRFRKPDGSPVWCEMTAHWSVALPAIDPTVTCIVRDITERVRGEEILRGASRMEATSTLAAGVAHDFNNLMTAILGNAELLLADANFPDAPSRLAQVAEAARRGGGLAQQLLAYARGGKYQTQKVDVNDLVDQAIRLQKHALPPRVVLETNCAPVAPFIEADPVQIGQVVTNLCLNAAEAIPGSGRVTIRTRQVTLAPAEVASRPGLAPGPTVLIQVTDTGKGIEPAVLPKIFEPFFSTKFQGRGLGLAAAYGIVKNHRGFIEVESALGRGTTFTIYIPATSALPPTPIQIREPFPTGDETLLLVDDDEAVIDVTKSILERLRYRVLVARHGIEAVEIARTFDGPIHLALLDMGMPFAGGAEAFPFLKAARPDMRILISSGYEMNEVVRGLLAAGADAFLQKPYRVTALARGLRQVLDREIAGFRLED